MSDFVSEIRTFAFPFDIERWVPCDGRKLNSNQYRQLFEKIGTRFGGDEQNFAVPDLRDRVLIGNGPAYPPFSRGGEEKHPLTIQEMPTHHHKALASTNGANSDTPRDHYWPADAGYDNQSNAVMSDQAIDPVGFGIPHDNMSPYTTLNYAICFTGMNLDPPAEVLGIMRVFAGDINTKDWLPCDGRLLEIAKNSALFQLIGTTYGGDGKTHFAIPDLRGRAAVGWAYGERPNDLSPYRPGDMAGVPSVTLTVAQMPKHYHPALASTKGNSQQPEGQVWANEDRRPSVDCFASEAGTGALMNPAAIGESGEYQPHNNMMPYQAIGYWIAISGTYPARG